MRHKINHEWPDDVQPMPEDNTTEYVMAQVAAWRKLGVLIHPQSAMEIASWWHSMGGYGLDLYKFQSTGTITDDLLSAIDSEMVPYLGTLQEWFSVCDAFAPDDHPADNLNALHALRAYVLAVQEMDCECSEEMGPCETDGEVMVMRAGASARTADDLLSVFIHDAVGLGFELSVWGREFLAEYDANLEANRSMGCAWLDDNNGELSDAMGSLVSQVEAQLHGMEYAVFWEDGFSIYRVTGGPLSSE